MSITSFRPGRFAAFSANTSRSARSCSISSRASGRWTLITTFSPVASVARWTWAIVPAASGLGSTVSKTSSHGTPSSSSIIETTSASERGATLSRRVASLDELRREQVGTRREDLPEFAERGAEPSRAAQPLRLPVPPYRALLVGATEQLRSPCFAKTTPIFGCLG